TPQLQSPSRGRRRAIRRRGYPGQGEGRETHGQAPGAIYPGGPLVPIERELARARELAQLKQGDRTGCLSLRCPDGADTAPTAAPGERPPGCDSMQPYINRRPLPPETLVWRYLSLDAVVRTVRCRKLRFTRVDRFPDPFEGSVPKQTIDDQL